MKKNGLAQCTIEASMERLGRLGKLCNLDEPEEVKGILATVTWKNSTKQNMAQIYSGYLKHIGKTWNEPKYKRESTVPYIPTEQELDAIINSGSPKTATFLQFLKETGARMGEAQRVKWIDIDAQRKTVYIRAEKNSNSRILPISEQLIAMLNRMKKINENVFQAHKHGLGVTYTSLRNRTTLKLNNPRLKAIHLHTFRHWKATTEYHKTKDIVHVKTILGHKSILSTMIYINIEASIFHIGNDDYTCKTAQNQTEASQLIESGFEYVTTIPNENIMLFRKRK